MILFVKGGSAVESSGLWTGKLLRFTYTLHTDLQTEEKHCI